MMRATRQKKATKREKYCERSVQHTCTQETAIELSQRVGPQLAALNRTASAKRVETCSAKGQEQESEDEADSFSLWGLSTSESAEDEERKTSDKKESDNCEDYLDLQDRPPHGRHLCSGGGAHIGLVYSETVTTTRTTQEPCWQDTMPCVQLDLAGYAGQNAGKKKKRSRKGLKQSRQGAKQSHQRTAQWTIG